MGQFWRSCIRKELALRVLRHKLKGWDANIRGANKKRKIELSPLLNGLDKWWELYGFTVVDITVEKKLESRI